MTVFLTVSSSPVEGEEDNMKVCDLDRRKNSFVPSLWKMTCNMRAARTSAAFLLADLLLLRVPAHSASTDFINVKE